MDFGDVFRMVGQFFIYYCGTPVTIFDTTFTVGTLFLWCAIATVLIAFIRGLAS